MHTITAGPDILESVCLLLLSLHHLPQILFTVLVVDATVMEASGSMVRTPSTERALDRGIQYRTEA